MMVRFCYVMLVVDFILLLSLFVKDALLTGDAYYLLRSILYVWPLVLCALALQNKTAPVRYLHHFKFWQVVPTVVAVFAYACFMWMFTGLQALGEYGNSLVMLSLFPLFMMPIWALGAFSTWVLRRASVKRKEP